jgi:cyclophilin family peptidyl-prolyl cis-trans isomerase
MWRLQKNKHLCDSKLIFMQYKLISFFMIGLMALMITASSCGGSATKALQTTVGTDRVVPANITFGAPTGADSYTWDFGDGTNSTDANAKHTYYKAGTYKVKLTTKKGTKMTEKEHTVEITEPDRYLVDIETSFGTMRVELSKKTPLHTANFLKLANEGYYDELLFHRVIWEFMIQGGDPNSRNAPAGQALGMGGPEYQIPAEITKELIHSKGALSAARTNNPEKKSSGSQFYVVQGRKLDDAALDQMESFGGKKYTAEQRAAYKEIGGTPHLDMEYTVFGHVIDGLGIIDQIAAVKTAPGDRPLSDVKMKIKVVK